MMALSWLRIAMVAVGGISAFPLSSFAVTIEQGSGANAAAIQAAVDAFRTTLGSPDNLNAPGPLGSGRREINWDGGGHKRHCRRNAIHRFSEYPRGDVYNPWHWFDANSRDRRYGGYHTWWRFTG